jgi:hypothetical protein
MSSKKFPLFLSLVFSLLVFSITSNAQSPDNIKAIYLTPESARNPQKIKMVYDFWKTTEINAVVIDVKIDQPIIDEYLTKLVSELNSQGIYTIARIVVMQDSGLARKRPDLAIKTKDGNFWYSGRKEWHRYWVDPAAPDVVDYNIAIAKRAIDIGFKEIQFDYIRFPSDGNMRNIVYPFYQGDSTKCAIMEKFFNHLSSELKKYKPSIVLSVDIFGEAYFNGQEPGIGQRLSDLEKYFDAICPMNYPSHFQCGEFGFRDPNQYPYEVMLKALAFGKKRLTNPRIVIRPWIQDFSIRNIYGCGSGKTFYGSQEVRAQIKAAQDTGSFGFMLWNASNRYTKGALLEKNK